MICLHDWRSFFVVSFSGARQCSLADASAPADAFIVTTHAATGQVIGRCDTGDVTRKKITDLYQSVTLWLRLVTAVGFFYYIQVYRVLWGPKVLNICLTLWSIKVTSTR